MKIYNSSSSGIGFAGLLTILFIYLKLTDKIDWSWWWIFSPLWISALVGIAVLFIFFMVIFIMELNK